MIYTYPAWVDPSQQVSAYARLAEHCYETLDAQGLAEALAQIDWWANAVAQKGNRGC